MKKYKVMTQKDRMFGGKFNPEKVEEALNSLGQEGWELKGVATAEFQSLTGGRQELVIFLEKDIQLIEKYGRKGTECEGVFFTEGPISNGVKLGELKVDSRKQNTKLDELKSQLASEVKKLGGNALENFNYVQQGTVFSFSSTRWRATGTAVKVLESDSSALPPTAL